MSIDLDRYINGVNTVDPVQISGRVTKVVGLVVEALGPEMAVGDLCTIVNEDGHGDPVAAEVVGFRDRSVLLMPLGQLEGVHPGSRIIAAGRSMDMTAGPGLLGRVLDGLGRPIDGKGGIGEGRPWPVHRKPPGPMERRRITEIISTGIRSIDGMLTCGVGQRMGIFSGSGVGKSTTLGMIARNTSADINVIGLIGERGREVKDFLEKDLGEEGLKRSVVICATSDEPALVRRQGAFLATAVAEYFRDQGSNVLFMMDSVTRFCTAQREIGLAIGEPPATKGYTPSVFAMLPKLLERTGAVEGAGSITGLYTILVEGDDMNEPVADAARAILDGHIVLSRDLAAQSHYPPVDVLESVSRLMLDIVSPEHRALAARIRHTLATYRRSADLITIGAYVKGSDAELDFAIDHVPVINRFLQQAIEEKGSYEDALAHMQGLFTEAPQTV